MILMKKVLLIVLIVLFSSPCFAQSIPPDTTIVLKQVPGGYGPMYTLTIYGDGHVEFVGQSNVAGMGLHQKSISIEKVTIILNAIDKLDFDHPDNLVCTDGGWVTLTLTKNGKTKNLTGSFCNGQDKDIEQVVEKIVELTEIKDLAENTFKGF